jgi:hypothetical protein
LSNAFLDDLPQDAFPSGASLRLVLVQLITAAAAMLCCAVGSPYSNQFSIAAYLFTADEGVLKHARVSQERHEVTEIAMQRLRPERHSLPTLNLLSSTIRATIP